MVTLGCIADDVTGATDVAAALRRSGLRVALLFGISTGDDNVADVDAVVIALKSRTLPAPDAIAQSLAALAWLREQDAQHLYVKYCSTFDSTDEGNIGPVVDAVLAALDERLTLICPASPEHNRTMYQGHLFVDDRLLNESSMRHHPLTPMADPDIPRVLRRQTNGPVELLGLSTVHKGGDAVTGYLEGASTRGVRHVVVDATCDEDLDAVAAGAADRRLLTGGAGLAGAWGAVLAPGVPGRGSSPAHIPPGPAIVLAGSCSTTTLAQVRFAAGRMPSYRIDPVSTPDPDALLRDAEAWIDANHARGPLLVYSSSGAEERERGRAVMGPRTPDVLENILGELAVAAVKRGARRVVVAGGETSGAIVRALDIKRVLVEDEADRGVPWCVSADDPQLALLLKSGNFGSEDLLVRAVQEPSR